MSKEPLNSNHPVLSRFEGRLQSFDDHTKSKVTTSTIKQQYQSATLTHTF